MSTGRARAAAASSVSFEPSGTTNPSRTVGGRAAASAEGSVDSNGSNAGVVKWGRRRVAKEGDPVQGDALYFQRIKLLSRPRLFLHQWGARQYWRVPLHLGLPPPAGNIERTDARLMCASQFRQRYELRCRPAIIDGLCDGQRCKVAWTPRRLADDFAGWQVLVGRGDGKDQVRLPADKFMEYCATEGRLDDSPLYVFDPEFGENPIARQLLSDYSVPLYFTEDLFQYAGGRRPPWRWFLWGSARSGSGVHIDPLATSAWNTLAHGRKWWVLLQPTTPKTVVKPKEHMPDETAMTWFTCILPRLIAAGVPRIEFIQQPGETVFVPGGWWHAVLNLDDTVAVTQNFVSSANFPTVWDDVADRRPGLASHWLHQLNHASVTLPHLRPLVALGCAHLRALASQSGTEGNIADVLGMPKETTVATFLAKRKRRKQEQKLNRRIQHEAKALKRQQARML